MPLTHGFRWLPGASLLCLLVATPALAQSGATASRGTADTFTVGELAQQCGEADPDLCYGYIMGAGQLYEQVVRAGLMHKWACADPTPTIEQIRQAFTEWAGIHPEAQDSPAVDGFWQAMSERWPCKAG
jgi:hypothetical protein